MRKVAGFERITGLPKVNFPIADYPPRIRSNVLLPKMGYGTPLQGRSS